MRQVIFIFPNKVASSALIELGYAIALEKPTLIMTERIDELPFMAGGLADSLDYAFIKIDRPFPSLAEEFILEFISEIGSESPKIK